VETEAVTAANAPAEACYATWPAPDIIVSDGAYGLRLFAGDPASVEGLPQWYTPHLQAWTERATPKTVLYFWGTELSWATVHPALLEHGWVYRNLLVWDKGLAHVAGRVNGKTQRTWPVSTEVCAFYARQECVDVQLPGSPLARWLRDEWQRAGFTLAQAHPVVGPAARKYFATDIQFYFPPPEQFLKLVSYANQNGDPAGRPYFEQDGRPADEQWYVRRRYDFTLEYGLTNVWAHPPLKPPERIARFQCQKPLRLMERIIRPHLNGHPLTVWEPFGGLASASIAAARLGCQAFVAEPDKDTFAAQQARLKAEV